MRAGIGIWLAERLQALDPEQMLSQGVSGGRDFNGYIRIERAWASSKNAF
jgi:hypothetical protein